MSEDVRDEYERQYMQPGERLLFREKVVSRAAFWVSVVFGVVFGGAGLIATLAAVTGLVAMPALAMGLPSLAFGAFMALAGVAFSVFRSMVTSSHVHVHFGWAKRKIPIDAIDDVSAITLTGFKQGKVSMGLDGVVRTWVGNSPSGRGVAITYREGTRKHVLTVGSEEAERFVQTIEAARASARSAARGGDAERERLEVREAGPEAEEGDFEGAAATEEARSRG